MIAEHGDSRVAQPAQVAQHVRARRSPIHQVAGEPESVATRIELQAFQQTLQRIETALHVADGVNGHGGQVVCSAAAMSIVALISALAMVGSMAEWPASGMISRCEPCQV